MNEKNLILKFSFVILLVALCLYQVFLGKGVRQGIDLRGGHSLIFEIRANQAEIERLQASRDELKGKLQQAKTDEERKKLQESIDRVENSLANLGSGGSASNLAERIINVLKRRIDPQGLLNTEWRPQGATRIEVRMPAAKEEVQQAKNAYLEALETLKQKNIELSDMSKVEQARGEARQAIIDRLARGNAELAAKLEAMGKAADDLAAARQGDDRARTLEALRRHKAAREAVVQTNISLQSLDSVLRQYVAPRERIGKDERMLRTETFHRGIARLLQSHPNRKDEIQKIVDLYRAWIDQRQGLDDPADLKRLIAKAGVLEFRIAPTLGAADGPVVGPDALERYKKTLLEEGPEALVRRNEPFLWFPIRGDQESFGGNLIVSTDAGGQKYVLLSNQPEYSMLHRVGQGGWSLTNPRPDRDDKNRPAVGFSFDARGARLFSALTGNNIGRHMAILLDNEAYSAPVIQAQISDSGIITGRFSDDQVADLVRTLESGSLPARLSPDPVSESTFGPALGEINLQMAMRAGILSLICVAVFMLAYYLLPGLIANIALILNLILILGTMSWLNAVFTLPGIAGVILAIGMAVDANVLIFERLREEQAKGQSIRMTLKNAYERAFSAILDGNLTTLLTCIILGWVGTEEVRGFAITLGLGILFNLFTAVIVTRWIFQALLDTGVIKRPLFMLQLIQVPKINWMGKRHLFYFVSAGMIVLGVASIAWQGKGIWGIEFSAGTQAVIKFKDDALLEGKLAEDRLVEQLLQKQAQAGGHERLLATTRVEARIDPNQALNYLRAYDTNNDQSISLQEWKAQGLNEQFFTLVDKAGKGSLDRAALEAGLPRQMFQITTSETSVKLIRDVTSKAYGDAQERRIPRTGYELVAGKAVPEIGLTLPDNGLLKIEPTDASPLRDDLENYRGGVLMVVRNIDPPMSEGELRQRIRDMRSQPDFEAQQTNAAEVRGIKAVGEKGYSAFAVLVRPAVEAAVEKPEGWNNFAQAEMDILKNALEREEAMIVTNFDPAIAGDTAIRAGLAVALSWVAIILYLWLRFGTAQWGLAAVICLIHDVTIVTGLVAVSGWLHSTFLGSVLAIDSFKIDLTMIAALLTIVGYSVNDTIVVFDRIRENRGKLSTVTGPVINTSINQTLSRTILTSGTTLIVVLIMYIWGGAGIHSFNFALLVGIMFGTYSSIAIASPLLMGFKAALVEKIVGEEVQPPVMQP